MAIQPHNLTDLICGILKLVEATDQRDSNKCVVWKAECICGQFEYGSRATLEKYAGHHACPGHPFKGKEKPVDGFRLHPDQKGTLEHAAVLADWKQRRDPEQSESNADMQLLIEGNKALRERLGLSGYKTETVTLNQSVWFMGKVAEKVVFAKQIKGDDRVLLHIICVTDNGARSIVASRKKMAEDEWQSVKDVLSGMDIRWRHKELKQVAA
jgi:hypothetical protein